MIRPMADPGNSITAAGLDALKADLHELETKGRQEMSRRIEAARSLGDLKENAEYHIAKDDQAHLETKILRLRERLRSAVVVDVDAEANGESVTFGRTAEVRDLATDKVHSWTIVGPTEASLAQGKLSSESPVAGALLGRSTGEEVAVETPGGTRRYRVEKIV
jgi:transcription elongation factor GreA